MLLEGSGQRWKRRAEAQSGHFNPSHNSLQRPIRKEKKKKPRAAELQAMGLKAEGIAVYLCSEQTDQQKEDEGEVSRISSARELVFLLACHTRENNLLHSFRQTLLCSQFCVCKQSAMAVEFEWMSSGPRNPWECKDERNLICSASISQDHLNAVNLFFFQTRAGGEIRIIQCEEE